MDTHNTFDMRKLTISANHVHLQLAHTLHVLHCKGLTDLTSRQVTALARTSSYSKLQTSPFVREGATTQQTVTV
jgi:hypothetical protein